MWLYLCFSVPSSDSEPLLFLFFCPPRCWVSPRLQALLLCHWSTLWGMGLISLMAPLPQTSLVSCQLSWWATSSSIHHLWLLSVSYNLHSKKCLLVRSNLTAIQGATPAVVLVFSWLWFLLQIQIRFKKKNCCAYTSFFLVLKPIQGSI